MPAETGGEDRLVGSLTFRHAAYLAVAAAGVAVMVLGHASTVRLALGAILAVTGVVGALLRPYGEPLDRLAVAAMAYLVRCRVNRVEGERAAPVDDHPAVENEELPDVPPEPAVAPARRSHIDSTAVRRVLVAAAVSGVAAIMTMRLTERPASTPTPHLVVVPIPVPASDPWGEVDRDLDYWLNSLG